MFSRRNTTFAFDLGAKVRDSVTKYEGVVTARTEYLNGCIRYIVEAMRDDDIKEFAFDEDRLTLLEGSRRAEPLLRTGGARPMPPRTGAR